MTWYSPDISPKNDHLIQHIERTIRNGRFSYTEEVVETYQPFIKAKCEKFFKKCDKLASESRRKITIEQPRYYFD